VRSWGAGRAEEEQVFAGDEAHAHQVDDLVLADEGGLHRVEHLARQALAEVQQFSVAGGDVSGQERSPGGRMIV